MIRITEPAQNHFSKLLANQNIGTQIRVFVINPGTHKAECGVSYCHPSSIEEGDTELKFTTFSAFIDQGSAPFLVDAEIDFVTDKIGSQLVLKAPHAKIPNIPKIPDNASLTERVEYVLRSKINPQLAAHGGKVTLIEITDDALVILKFSGGCNGCSMINFTLKNGIEKELLQIFPKLKGVKDITEHQQGKHSYY